MYGVMVASCSLIQLQIDEFCVMKRKQQIAYTDLNTTSLEMIYK